MQIDVSVTLLYFAPELSADQIYSPDTYRIVITHMKHYH